MRFKSLQLVPGFDSTAYFDTSCGKRWQKLHDGSYTLQSPDLKKDRLFAVGSIKVSPELKEKQDSQRLYITGVANANVVDRMSERLDPSGVELEFFSKNSQLLAHHSYYHPIGQVESITPEEDGVKFRAWIGDPEKAELTAMQKEIRSLVSQGILRTVSVGFIPKKMRPPLFDDQGNMTEPLVIEKWELLELSVVAVPCNQDSLFETLDIQNTSQGKKTGIALEQSNGNTNDVLSELEASGIDLDQGAKAVVTKRKDTTDEKASESTDNKEDQYKTELMTLTKGMFELVKRVVELNETILAKLEEKPMEDEEEKPAGNVVEEDDEEEKSLSERLTALETLVTKVVKSIEVIASKK